MEGQRIEKKIIVTILSCRVFFSTFRQPPVESYMNIGVLWSHAIGVTSLQAHGRFSLKFRFVLGLGPTLRRS